MDAVINVALPVFGIMLAGVLAGRTGLLGQSSTEALNRFVYFVALPPVLFLGMTDRPLGELFNGAFLGAFLGAMLVVFALAMLVGRLVLNAPPAEMVMQGLAASFCNTGYMGIPLFLAAFGPDQLTPVILATVIMGAVMTGLPIAFLEFLRSAEQGAGTALSRAVVALARNPLVIAPALGLLWSWVTGGLVLPTPVATFCGLLGAAAGPCALFAIGLFLASRPLRADLGEVLWLAGLKLVVQPLLTALLIATVFPLDRFWALSALILAALPTGALPFVVAQQYGAYVERTSAVILVSTVLSVVTLSGLLATMVR